MKSDIIQNGPKVESVNDYPYLAYHDASNETPEDSRLIVLFTAPATGVAVYRSNEWSPGSHRIGEYSELWQEQNFTRLPDEYVVQLSND